MTIIPALHFVADSKLRFLSSKDSGTSSTIYTKNGWNMTFRTYMPTQATPEERTSHQAEMCTHRPYKYKYTITHRGPTLRKTKNI